MTTTDPTTTKRVYETRISRVAAAPRGNRFARWRWDVTRYAVTEPLNHPTRPGNAEGRWHLWGDCGYTFTRLGAALAVAWEITEERP